MVLPFRLASATGPGFSDLAALQDAVASGLVRTWESGDGRLDARLAEAADFWQRFHFVKAALAAVLLVVLVRLALRASRQRQEETSWAKRFGLGVLGAMSSVMGVLALLVVVANSQGVFAPLSSVLGVVSFTSAEGQLSVAVSGLAQDVKDGSPTSTTALFLDDFVTYHQAMVVLGVVVVGALAAVLVGLLRQRATTAPTEGRRHRAVVGRSLGLLTLAAAFAVITVANVSTVANPMGAFTGFLAGGA